MGWFWNGKCNSKARLDGKTVVITGCNTGIGRHTVLDLYRRGARVAMACRDLERAEAARQWVAEKSVNCAEAVGTMVLYHLDLASLASVRKCAQKILEQEANISLLINNAGVMMCERSLTEDGFESQFATNHLGHFLLTLLLLPKVIAAAPSRIVNVSSRAHIFCESMYFDDINMEKSYSARRSYGRSKMANILFTRELARRLKDTPGVTVYSLHPGVVDTELSRHLDRTVFPGAKWMFQNLGGWFMKSPEQGAQTTLYCALEEETASQTGLYYDDCQVVTPNAMARDDELAKKLWDVSLDLVKYTPPHPFGKSTS